MGSAASTFGIKLLSSHSTQKPFGTPAFHIWVMGRGQPRIYDENAGPCEKVYLMLGSPEITVIRTFKGNGVDVSTSLPPLA